MIDKDTHRFWLHGASRGSPPPIEEVARYQYDLQVPHFWRDHFFDILRNLKSNGPKHRYAREVARDNGKTTLVYFLILYHCEYTIPFMKGLRSANRRVALIGRDKNHVNDSLMDGLHKMLAEYAPWLKDQNWEEVCEKNEITVLEMGIRRRTWNKDLFTLSNGVSIRGLSVKQSPRSEHVPLVAVDDLITEDNWMFSHKYHRWLTSAVQKAILPGGILLVTGTPQSDGDLYDLLADDDRWSYVQLPGFDYNKTYGYKETHEREIQRGNEDPADFTHPDDWHCIWTSRLNAEGHEDERGNTPQSLSSYRKEILLIREPEDDAFVKHVDAIASKDPSLHYTSASLPGEGPYYGGFDPSSLSKDDACACIGFIDEKNNRIPRHFRLIRAKGKSARLDSAEPERDAALGLNASSLAFGNPYIKLEKNGFQGMIAPFLRDLNPTIALSKIHLGSQKHTEAGWLAVRTLFRNRLVRLPYGPTPMEASQIAAGLLDPSQIEARRITDEFIQQLMNLRVVEGRIISANPAIHDDMVSAFFLFVKAAEGGSRGSTASVAELASSLPSRSPHQDHYDPELSSPTAHPAQGRLHRAMQLASSRRLF